MFKKVLSIAAVSIISLFSFSSISAYAEEMPTELRSNAVQQVQQIQYFDENDNPIFPYANLDANSYSDSITTHAHMDFGAASFSNYIWIRSGQAFLNPQDIEFERENRPKSVSIYAYTSGGSYVGKGVVGEGTGWALVPWRHLPRGQFYTFKFVSESGQLVKVKHGTVYYG
ncbi:hypothetical protein QUF93_00390 [Bacillus hominis]|uniref:hypothetical protein n=1 Tax=Bacillus hominis TaxID=2817478 RepID=UPI0025A1D5C3|nr:hypothetical protein [Bacillus hominis]MDM5191187.1 hypothetical protein [Bacillus hominis]